MWVMNHGHATTLMACPSPPILSPHPPSSTYYADQALVSILIKFYLKTIIIVSGSQKGWIRFLPFFFF